MSSPIDVVDLTMRLVAIDSVSKQSNAPVADVLAPILTGAGFAVERLEYDDDAGERKVSLIGVKGAGSGGLAFLSHLDTVPGIGWDRDPWSPVIDGDHLIGLGSCDMKGPLAATVAAAAKIDADCLARPVVIVATADEEITGRGAIDVAGRSTPFATAAPRWGVVAEPTRLIPVYAHKGGAFAYVTAYGVAAHTSLDQGISANFLIAPFLAEMATFAIRLQTDVSYHNSAFIPPTLGFNMTLDDGGCKQNVTAAKTVCTLCFRPMPNDRSEEILAFIGERARRHGLEVTTTFFPPFAVSPDTEIVRAALAATGAPQAETVPFGTEAIFYDHLLEQVVLGPGDIAQAHTNGEWISISQLHEAVAVYSRMIERLCMQ
jgi:acetylornithine deacetylase